MKYDKVEIIRGPSSRKRRKPNKDLWFFVNESEEEQARVDQCCELSLADAGLPIKIVNRLEDYRIFTVGDLAKTPLETLTGINNLGVVSVNKCRQLLNSFKIPHKLE